jgi:hypothetical protein
MGLFLIFEASQANGKTYRLGPGWIYHPKLASMVGLIVRLF